MNLTRMVILALLFVSGIVILAWGYAGRGTSGKSRSHYTNLPKGGIRFHSYFHWETWHYLLIDLRYVSLLFYNAWFKRFDGGQKLAVFKIMLLWDTTIHSHGICGVSVAVLGMQCDMWLQSPDKAQSAIGEIS